MTAEDVVQALELRPHPEGGAFRETWREPAPSGEGRDLSAAIYFLLRAGEVSHWHRFDACEIWHHYAGAPLEHKRFTPGEAVRVSVLGSDLGSAQRPQVRVAAHVWQSARSLGDWTLCGCTTTPAFEFGGFELAPPGWEPA